MIDVPAGKTKVRLEGLNEPEVKSYKVWVRAYVVREGKKIPISTSLKIDSFLKEASAVYTNPKSVHLKTKKISLTAGQKAKITASVKKEDPKKRLTPHLPALRYVSSNTGVATVAEDGTVKAVGNGKCRVYVIAPNGIWKTVRVAVGVKAEKISFTENKVKIKAGEKLDLAGENNTLPDHASDSIPSFLVSSPRDLSYCSWEIAPRSRNRSSVCFWSK